MVTTSIERGVNMDILFKVEINYCKHAVLKGVKQKRYHLNQNKTIGNFQH